MTVVLTNIKQHNSLLGKKQFTLISYASPHNGYTFGCLDQITEDLLNINTGVVYFPHQKSIFDTLNIVNMPTLILYCNGKEIERIEGLHSTFKITKNILNIAANKQKTSVLQKMINIIKG